MPRRALAGVVAAGGATSRAARGPGIINAIEPGKAKTFNAT
jgi:hypothetical protein